MLYTIPAFEAISTFVKLKPVIIPEVTNPTLPVRMSVPVPVGNVRVPPFNIDEIVGLVNVLFVSDCVSVVPTISPDGGDFPARREAFKLNT